MAEPLVYIIITNYQGVANRYGSEPLLKVCLDSLLSKTRYTNYRVIVSDDKSHDGSVSFVKKNYPHVAVAVDRQGWNSARTINNGIRSINGPFDFALIMANDVIVRDGAWLSRLVRDALKTDAGVTGCRLLYPSGRVQHAGYIADFPLRVVGRNDKNSKRYSRIRRADAVTAALMLISKKTMKGIGLFNELYRFGPCDVEYCMEARKAGFTVICDGRVGLTHLEGATTTNSKGGDTKFRAFYYSQRDFIYFVKNNFGTWRLPYVFLYELLYSVISTDQVDGKRRLAAIRIKNAPLRRIYLTLKAWMDYVLRSD